MPKINSLCDGVKKRGQSLMCFVCDSFCAHIFLVSTWHDDAAVPEATCGSFPFAENLLHRQYSARVGIAFVSFQQ